MDFSEALRRLKSGACVAREGWNGKGMFLWLEKGSDADLPDGDTPEANPLLSGVPIRLFEHGDKGTVRRMPCLCMRAADGATVTGWLASQTDMLAEDWGSL